ncbi:tRNA (adenine(22)-N(1))-methyltransferase [Aquibacillus albus]|uniref:tRNA (Adenine22-N1)-methyltransferase n=1 Tax=Aquibacillus albus TaxID=1168171 RepID=A0ABS2MV97_9BACI|nr:tRNA (adenine(22)-N(1))-methyltransferase TrmK [Aquibacillus albus]MBM7569640.1 tRNA (adenine22-N1)-methyltransferase [Aquibacillus albus]
MNEIMLSDRLQMIASFLPEEAIFADIGSDHAYLPCYVCLNNLSAKAIAGEVNDGPYQRAKRTVESFNLMDRIDVRKGDGLSVLQEDEVAQLVIAGMGGSLISHILETGKDKLGSVERIIAQPNMDAMAIRKWFHLNNFELINEKIIEEDGHIYEILIADKGIPDIPYSEDFIQNEFLFGPFLLQEKSEPFKQKWVIEKEKRERAVSQMKKAKSPDYQKISQFESEIQLIQEVLDHGQSHSSQ